MILRTSQKNKLDVQREGPAQVVQKLSDTNYVVSLPGKRKVQQIYLCNLLKPYQQREAVVNMLVNIREETSVEFPDLVCETNGEATDEVIENLAFQAQLTPDQRNELQNLLHEFRDIFVEKPGRTSVLIHDIELTASESVWSKAYRVSARQ